ncbi:Hypothetical protein, predicted transmembrane protein [Mycoplasma yeatsii 13926]|uniref:Transmembrane protein n=1 Tax=Mycoplasma yeatsii 13926 TaxID=1188240 RepID=S6G3K9_9MOLU|nr:hypothetical protein [Mycoplasma yeatsii]EOA07296.1 Hypothetical protein, predicted transmembrane protein [Mycoplasma yeatsii 13926]
MFKKRFSIISYLSMFKDLNYLTTTALITALLIALASTTSMINLGVAKFQVADGVFLSLACFIPGPMMAVSGTLYAMIFDIISGGVMFVPASLVIHLIMFILVKLLIKKIPFFLVIVIAELPVFLYILYGFSITWFNQGLAIAKTEAIKSLITDVIQYGISVGSGIVLCIAFSSKSMSKIFETITPNQDFDIKKENRL